MIDGDMHLVSPGEEMLRASNELRRLAVKASGQDWHAVSHVDRDSGQAVAGLATDGGRAVIGCDAVPAGAVITAEDAACISAADPGTVLLLADLLHVASKHVDASPNMGGIVELALKMSRRINHKFKDVDDSPRQSGCANAGSFK